MRLISAIVLSLLMVQLHSCMALTSDEDYSEEYWMEKASNLRSEGLYDLALMCIDKSLEINSNNSEAWLLKGDISYNIYFRTYQKSYLESAPNYYDRAIQINPLNKDAWANKASCLSRVHRKKEAIEAYDRATELDPNNFVLWERKADYLFKSGKYKEAIEAYNQVIKLNPQSYIWIKKADSLSKIGKYKEAIEAYDRALLDQNHSYSIWIKKAEALSKIGKYNEAIEVLDRSALPYYQPYYQPYPQNIRAKILWESGRYYEALLSYYKAQPMLTTAVFVMIVIIIKRKSLIRMIKGKKVSQSENLEQALTVFEGVKSPILSALFRGIPYITVPIIIYCISQDWMLIPGILALLLTFKAFQSLMRRIPKVLGALWYNHLIFFRPPPPQVDIENKSIDNMAIQSQESDYSKFVDEFESRLNSRYQWLFGLFFSIGWIGILEALTQIYPEIEKMLPQGDIYILLHLALGSFIGLMIGFMAWRMAVITYMTREIGKRLAFNIQFGNPDKCGGLEPLGNLCLWNSLVLSIPGIYIAGSSIIIIILFLEWWINLYISEIDTWIIEDAFIAIPALIMIFNFIISQWGIHTIMVSQRNAEWQNISEQFELSKRMAAKIYQSDTKEENEKQIKELDLLQKIYLSRRDQSYPTWPFSLGILAKFLTGIPLILVPIISLIIDFIKLRAATPP